MKTRIFSIAAILTIVLGVGNLTYAADKKGEAGTVVTDVRRIYNIEVHGNVELYVSNATTDQVKVYNRYYAEHALVQSEGGVLRITSYNAEKLVVWVTASDLRSITAYDNSEVKSFGKLSSIDLDVKLHNNALANLSLDAYSAKIKLSDHAKANIDGSAEKCEVRYDRSSTVNNINFTATQFSKAVNEEEKGKIDDQLVTL
jgi:hypothetical protein